MKIAFVSELPFMGKVTEENTEMRTEFAWMCALKADHFPITSQNIEGYDLVIIIFPKGEVFLNAVGTRLVDKINPVSDTLKSDLFDRLKSNNGKLIYMQEGPNWLFNDYTVEDQINFYTQLSKMDMILAHNESDSKFYKGLFPNMRVGVMRSLMITDLISKSLKKEDETIIGGNFSRWYGGFQSYVIAQRFENSIWVQSSHSKRVNEDRLDNLSHLERVPWLDWINNLSRYRYAVHMMPTVAAGTFSLNCAYWGIPCIGNDKVDTQRLCFPDISVDIDDIQSAVKYAEKLKDESFYSEISSKSKELYEKYYSVKAWKDNFTKETTF